LQFDEHGVPLPAIADVLAAFAYRTGAWELALWFTGANAWLGDRRPVEVLGQRPGGDPGRRFTAGRGAAVGGIAGEPRAGGAVH
jgi:hypothetical protein